MRKQLIALVGVLVVLLAAADAVAEHPEWVGKAHPEIRRGHIAGNGRWKAHGQRQRLRQRWSVDVERNDEGSISGQLVVEDSELFSSGHIEGSVRGGRITGVIFSTHGDPVAQFNGVATSQGINGSYTDRTGGTGEWFWDGPLPD